MKLLRNSYGFNARSTLFVLALGIWAGALTAGFIGPWLLVLAPLLLWKNATCRLILCTVLIGSSALSLRIHAIHQIPKSFEVSNNFTATVQSDPLLVAGKVRGSYMAQSSWAFNATLTKFGEYRTHLPIRIFISQQSPLIPSDIISGYGRVSPSKDSTIAGAISVREIQVIRGANWPNRVAERIRNHFTVLAQNFGGDAAELVPGMVLGDTSGESQHLLTAMKRSGLTHLTAVSGENFAIIALAVLWLLQWPFPRNLALRNAAVALVLAGFLILVRPSPSVLRAAVMTGIFLLSRARGKKSHSLNALGLAVAILILLNPFEARSFGFALSVAATAGIIIYAERLEGWLSAKLMSSAISRAISIPLAATLLCTPLIVLLSGQISLTSLPANLAASLAVSPITIIGLISALLAPIWAWAAAILFKITLPFAWWITTVATIAANPPVIAMPKNIVGAAIPILAGVVIFKKMWKTGLSAVLAFALLTFFSNVSWPGPDWQIVNCDVGQGDGMVIKVDQNSAIVIDVGPDPEQMNSCLKRLGIRRIPLLVLTHFHVDHVTGLPAVLKGRSIGEVWLSHEHEPFGEYNQVMAELHGYSITEVSQGESYSVGPNIFVKVLWPLKNPPPASMSVSGTEINNQSIALIIHDRAFTLFAGGDIETDSQMQIAASGMVAPVDILKVSHHGSRSQYLPLLDALSPRIAFISVGEGNMYGHPAPSLIQALTSRHIKIFRTDLDGALAFDSRLHERAMHRQWWSLGLD